MLFRSWRRLRIAELKAERKRLHEELKAARTKRDQRPATLPDASAEAPGAANEGALDEEARREIVERFHILYRDVMRLDKRASWRGTRVIKCPLDLWIYQELVYELEPDLIIETGTMDGGSALYFASLLDLAGKGEIVTVDKVDRPGRPAHPRISYVLGSSIDDAILADLRVRAEGNRTVLVVLDSLHTENHVLAELRAYRGFVTPGSYMVVEDSNVNGHPVFVEHGPGPLEAVTAWLPTQREFEVDRGCEKFLLTANPMGYLRRR